MTGYRSIQTRLSVAQQASRIASTASMADFGGQSAARPQIVADIVEANGVSNLGVGQADRMTSRTERARLPVHSGFPRQFRHQMRQAALPRKKAEPR